MIKQIGHTQICRSCGDGRVTYYLYTDNDNPLEDALMTPKEMQLGGIIIGECNTCGMCCGETQIAE